MAGEKKPAQATTPSKPTQTTTNNTQTNTQTTQKDNTTTAPSTTTPTTTTSDVNAFEQEVAKLTNAERTKAGLSALQTDTKLMAAAREKSQDMQSKKTIFHIQAQHSVHHLIA